MSLMNEIKSKLKNFRNFEYFRSTLNFDKICPRSNFTFSIFKLVAVMYLTWLRLGLS